MVAGEVDITATSGVSLLWWLLSYWWLKVWVIAAVVLLRVVVVVVWWRPRKIEAHFAKQGIRGPPYRLLLGNVKELVELMIQASAQPMPNLSHNILPRVFSFYHHWKKIYGATFLVWFGPTARVTVSDPELIREIFSSKSQLYQKKEANPIVRQLEGNGLISLKGEKWAHHRRIISPTFHMENLKLLIPVVARSVDQMIHNWHVNKDDEEVEVEVSECFQSLTEEVITRMTFGSRKEDYEQGRAIFALQNQQMVLAAAALQKILIPGYSYLPTSSNIKSWRLDKEIRRSLAELIQRRKVSYGSPDAEAQQHYTSGSSSSSSHHKDLLGLMIQDSSSAITVQDIVEECKGFFFAGKQTTSNLMTWTTVLLAMHPHWQDLARQELLRVCGESRAPTKDDLIKLKTLTMILNESLRLYPPVIATIRTPKHDVDLRTIRIPAGTQLLVPILAVHHDRAIWGDDVSEFNPARFQNGTARAARHPAAFIPFGLGVRTCVGQNLALLEAKLVLALLLQRFEFRLAPSYRHAPTVLMLLYPQHGAPVVFRRLRRGVESELTV